MTLSSPSCLICQPRSPKRLGHRVAARGPGIARARTRLAGSETFLRSRWSDFGACCARPRFRRLICNATLGAVAVTLIPALFVHLWLPLFALGALGVRLLYPIFRAVEFAQWFLRQGARHPLRARSPGVHPVRARVRKGCDASPLGISKLRQPG